MEITLSEHNTIGDVMKIQVKKKSKPYYVLLILLVASLIIYFTLSNGTNKISPILSLNEIVTDNSSLHLGDEEQYYDYIELKNTSNDPLNLLEYYISDDPKDIYKWQLPEVILQPNDLLLIYASGENKTTNEYHTNFKLSKSGTYFIISNEEGVISKINVPELDEDIAYGLNDDNEYAFFNVLTPGMSNYDVSYTSINEIGNSVSDSKILKINEISAEDQQAIYDEDGDFSDFIELYNTSEETVDISGYFLSDDPDKPSKYQIKEYIMQPSEFLIIFASDKDKENNGYIHTNFQLSAGETLYLYNKQSQLVDSVDIPTMPDNASYGRDPNDLDHWLYFNTPTPSFENSTKGSESYSEAKLIEGSPVYISEVLSANQNSLLDGNGENEDWIEIYNQTDKAIDLNGWYLSDSMAYSQKWAFPDSATIEPGESMLIFASGNNFVDKKGYMHTNFSLNKYNQTIVLSKENVIMDTLDYGMMKGDTSIGINNPTDITKYYYKSPTPGKKNNTTAYSGISGEVRFSKPSGFYNQSVTIEISSVEKGISIYYTTDGSSPTTKSNLYTGPITISKNTSLRAVSYKQGKLLSDISTSTYLIDEESTELPVVFLTTDNSKLFNGGIYNSNLSDDRKVDANIELLEIDLSGFNKDVLINKSGNMSALEPQKSFGVYFKESVGDSELNYDLFPDDPDGVMIFKSFLLRTSGNDWDDMKCKDGMLQTLAMTEMDLDYMSYRPAILYINGKYWGIYNIRDKVNGDYLAAHHPGVDADNIDIISFGYGVHEGDYSEYYKMINFIRSVDLNDADNWDKVESMIDVDNCIDTYLCHIYYSNFDTVNIKWWREREEGAKWRWILYDLDYSLYVPYQNNLQLISDPVGHGVNKYFDSSLMYNLMQSKYFREKFIEKTSKYWPTIFNSNVILEHLNETFSAIASEMPRQLDRWNISVNHLIAEMDELDDFLRRRPELFRTMFKNYFNLTTDELNKYLPAQEITYPKVVIDRSVY